MSEEIKEKPIKTYYSNAVKGILDDVWVNIFLQRCHKVRAELKLKTISDLELIISVLKNYEAKKINFIAKKKRKGQEVVWFKNGSLKNGR
jgi:hypothetical protein